MSSAALPGERYQVRGQCWWLHQQINRVLLGTYPLVYSKRLRSLRFDFLYSWSELRSVTCSVLVCHPIPGKFFGRDELPMFQSPSKESVCACETLPAVLRFGIVLRHIVLLFDVCKLGFLNKLWYNSYGIVVMISRLSI